MTADDLGAALTGSYQIRGGHARLYERGVVIDGPGGEVVVRFKFPMIGRPHVATGAAPALEASMITFRRKHYELNDLVPLVRGALAGRVGLAPTGEGPQPRALTADPVEEVEPERPSGVGGVVIPAIYGVSLSGQLRERQLYDVVLAGDGGTWHIVAPHAVYHKSAWIDFGLAHITDIHVARRIDSFRPTLYAIGRPGAAAGMLNWNDRFRGFVRYANYLHGIGALDVIVATGDLYDYQFEADDDPAGLGNALFMRKLILGQAPGPDFPDVEELRVPIFVVPGNHDYRKHPYFLIFDLKFGPLDKRMHTHANYNLSEADATALWNAQHGGDGIPVLGPESAARMVEVDASLPGYKQCLAGQGSYVIRLGSHRVVMLDSAHDVGVLTTPVDGLREWLGFASDDEHTFAGGSPNCQGISKTELKLAADALIGMPTGGLFIVGLHAPLFNLWSDEYPYFLRETQRRDQNGQDHGWLARYDKQPLLEPVDKHMEQQWPLWFPGEHDHRKPSFVKRGGNGDLLDYGVSRGRAEELLRLLAGAGSLRPADVVLAGHTHSHNEFVVNISPTGELVYTMDFYTANPTQYYPTPFVTGYRKVGNVNPHRVAVTSEVTNVELDAEALPDASPWPMPYADAASRQLQVPPYPSPLSTAADPRAWWAAHRPLVLQTGALGPLDNHPVSFSGFRLLSVKGDVIDKVHFIPTARLEANGYRLPVDMAVQPEPARRLRHSERSRRHHAPLAQGTPAGIWLPALGVTSAVYRDLQGHLHELWKDTAGNSGTGNATELGGGPPAAGDPSLYFDRAGGNLITLYRAGDGNVHLLYWSTGAVGHDNLTGSIGAPRAAGNPHGYDEANGVNHVIYRSGDGHMHELWWSGGDPAGHGDLTQVLAAPLAAGDPSPWVDTARGRNHVAYRGTDGHVRALYWSGESEGHEDLSGFAGAPNAAGDPVGYYIPRLDLQQVTYRGVGGNIHELYCVGEAPIAWRDLTAFSGAPPAAGDPAVYYHAATNTKHVVYRSADGHLNEIWWPPDGTPAYTPTTVWSLAPPAAGDPAAFTVDGPNSQHVVYRGTDGQIHEIAWV